MDEYFLRAHQMTFLSFLCILVAIALFECLFLASYAIYKIVGLFNNFRIRSNVYVFLFILQTNCHRHRKEQLSNANVNTNAVCCALPFRNPMVATRDSIVVAYDSRVVERDSTVLARDLTGDALRS